MVERRLRDPIVLSIVAAVVTLALKWFAYSLTGSVGLLSDVAESAVNLLAAGTAYLSLWYAARPIDPTHTYGHQKIEYFSSGLEGVVIVAAAAGVSWYAALRLLASQPPEQLPVGISLTSICMFINLGVAIVLLRVGRRSGSIVLEAGGVHLMTDVWTSVAVIVGLGMVWLTGRPWFDPVIGLLIAIHVCRSGFGLIRRSFNGLMDHALPPAEQDAVRQAIRPFIQADMDFHALRTRQAGTRRFVDFHLLVPGAWTVRQAHDVVDKMEEAVCAALPGAQVTVHIEPIEDRTSWEDSELLSMERSAQEAQSPLPPPAQP
jgi:cation diffusion facilitator family transporter